MEKCESIHICTEATNDCYKALLIGENIPYVGYVEIWGSKDKNKKGYCGLDFILRDYKTGAKDKIIMGTPKERDELLSNVFYMLKKCLDEFSMEFKKEIFWLCGEYFYYNLYEKQIWVDIIQKYGIY